jgi:hypothetical protein
VLLSPARAEGTPEKLPQASFFLLTLFKFD